jgi:serine/threonine protein kinase
MGEVYRAPDTKLGRDVALRVPPPDVDCDPERLARLQREARLAQSLPSTTLTSSPSTRWRRPTASTFSQAEGK